MHFLLGVGSARGGNHQGAGVAPEWRPALAEVRLAVEGAFGMAGYPLSVGPEHR